MQNKKPSAPTEYTSAEFCASMLALGACSCSMLRQPVQYDHVIDDEGIPVVTAIKIIDEQVGKQIAIELKRYFPSAKEES